MVNEQTVGSPEPGLALDAQLGLDSLRQTYLATLINQVRESLVAVPTRPPFSLRADTSAAISTPDEIGDPDYIVGDLGLGTLNSVLANPSELQATLSSNKLEAYWGGSSGESKTEKELSDTLNKLKKLIAFLEAMTKALHQQKATLADTEEADKDALSTDSAAQKRNTIRGNIDATLEEIGSPKAKQGLIALKGLALKTQEYIATTWNNVDEATAVVQSEAPVENA
ncbi:hypothetical protein KBB12_02625 [Candidatus Woesebacteria bacterium]|nr:hypothetical protein [Candidatus Woesebacteria bacterium]